MQNINVRLFEPVGSADLNLHVLEGLVVVVKFFAVNNRIQTDCKANVKVQILCDRETDAGIEADFKNVERVNFAVAELDLFGAWTGIEFAFDFRTQEESELRASFQLHLRNHAVAGEYGNFDSPSVPSDFVVFLTAPVDVHFGNNANLFVYRNLDGYTG